MPGPKLKGNNYSRTIVLDESATYERKGTVYGKQKCNQVNKLVFEDVFNTSDHSSPFGTSGSDSSKVNKKRQQETKCTYTNMRQRKQLINNSSSLDSCDHSSSSDRSHENFTLFTEFTVNNKKNRVPLKNVNGKPAKKRKTVKKSTLQKKPCNNLSLEKEKSVFPDFDSIEKDEFIIDVESHIVQSSSTPKEISSKKSTRISDRSKVFTLRQNCYEKNISNHDQSSNDIINNDHSTRPLNVTYRRPRRDKKSSPEYRKSLTISHEEIEPLSPVNCSGNNTMEESSAGFHSSTEHLIQSLHELEIAPCLNSTMNSPAPSQGFGCRSVESEPMNLSNISMDLFDDDKLDIEPCLILERIDEKHNWKSLQDITEESTEEDELDSISYETEISESEESQSLLVESECQENSNISRSTYSNIISESFSEKLMHSLLDETVATTAEEKILQLCGQTEPVSFYDCIPKKMDPRPKHLVKKVWLTLEILGVMSKSTKIGEGVYGEVFRTCVDNQSLAVKIIPMEGDLIVNDCPPKKFEEILPEIVIAQELSNLAVNEANRTDNFCQVKRISCVKGEFPEILLEKWDEFDEAKTSENDRPDNFSNDQLFIVFEFYDGGCALEKYKFSSALEMYSAVRQVVFALAVAEDSLEFEHRDLHIGNILVKPCKQETVSFNLAGGEFVFPTHGVFATIIDFTISRLKKDGCAVFCDVASDDGLFEGTGDFQFDVYRDMKKENGNDWQKYNPHSNVLWVNYLLKKLMIIMKKKKETGRLRQETQKKFESLIENVLEYSSCLHLALEEIWT